MRSATSPTVVRCVSLVIAGVVLESFDCDQVNLISATRLSDLFANNFRKHSNAILEVHIGTVLRSVGEVGILVRLNIVPVRLDEINERLFVGFFLVIVCEK